METLIALVSDPRTGVVAAFAFGYWFERIRYLAERDERIAIQARLFELQERVLNGLNNGTVALKSVVEAENNNHLVLSSLKDLLLSGRISTHDGR